MANFKRVTLGVGLALAACGLSSSAALADEGGVSFFALGQYASFAAIAPAPGFNFASVAYGFWGTPVSTLAMHEYCGLF